MTAVKLTKAQLDDLASAYNNNESITLRLSSRMLVNPDEGMAGVVYLPLSKRQTQKLINSIRATPYTISKTNIKKLMRLNKSGSGAKGDPLHGSGFGDFLKSVASVPVKAAKYVGKKAVDVGSKVLDKAVEEAIVAAPLMLLGAGVGSASVDVALPGRRTSGTINGNYKLGVGGSGGYRGSGKVVRMGGPSLQQNVSKDYISGT